MYLGQPNLERLELTELLHQTSHSYSGDLKIVYDDLRYSEIMIEEEACRT